MENTNNYKIRQGQNQLIPFLWIRRGIGFLGIIFPLILWLGNKIFSGCDTILGSVSDYYHSHMHDVFVGILCVIALFLFTYRGPESKDNIAANLACIFALGIAFFPTNLKEFCTQCTDCPVQTFPSIHNFFAATFFLVLIYFSLVLFPKTNKNPITGENLPCTPQKLIRNKVYKTCGIIMLVSIIAIACFMIFNINAGSFPLIFTLEWVALAAFGISWIVKGQWFLEDK
jgi:hypothetical protein